MSKKHKKPVDKIKKYDWSNKNILIAEDNDNNFLLCEIVLEPTSINITRIKSRNDFDELYNVKFDIILMDLRLFDCSGFDLIKEIRTNNTQVPIITVTAFTSSVDEILSYECGSDFFMTKPIKWNDLLIKVDFLLKNKR